MSVEVAIVGAGPYGLSLAAHLAARGVDFRVFGKPMESWRAHMPHDMLLKSDGFASNLSAPDPKSTLKAFSETRGLPYSDQRLPTSLSQFIAYADWFQKRYVPMLEDVLVTGVSKAGELYRLQLESGETLEAKHVVLAVGITWFASMPETLAKLPAWACSHTFAHREGFPFKGQEVAVIGAGASSINAAALFHDNGARVTVFARDSVIDFHNPPDVVEPSLLERIQRPSSPLGPGWRSFMCTRAPLLFHALPERLRLRVTKRHLGPAPGWFMRDRAVGKFPMLTNHHLEDARTSGASVILTMCRDGETFEQEFDHVVAGTGFRSDLSRLTFVEESLRSSLDAVEGTPILSENFETSSRGLYVVGPLAANAFGPYMRFMAGAEFAAPRLSAHLARKIGAKTVRQAA